VEKMELKSNTLGEIDAVQLTVNPQDPPKLTLFVLMMSRL